MSQHDDDGVGAADRGAVWSHRNNTAPSTT
jgi:hypothetical protein